MSQVPVHQTNNYLGTRFNKKVVTVWNKTKLQVDNYMNIMQGSDCRIACIRETSNLAQPDHTQNLPLDGKVVLLTRKHINSKWQFIVGKVGISYIKYSGVTLLSKLSVSEQIANKTAVTATPSGRMTTTYGSRLSM